MKPKLRKGHNRSQVERLFGICAAIQARSRFDGQITAQSLARQFDVDRRTILRDIEFLRERLGVEISYDPQEHSYILADNFKNLPPLMLENADYLTICFLEQCLKPYVETDIGGQMYSSFRRMFSLLFGSDYRGQFRKNIVFKIEERPNHGIPGELRVFNILYRAIETGREVEIQYSAPNKPCAQKTVRPYRLLFHKGRWYLYGVDCGKNELRVFHLSRIQNITATQTTFREDPSLKADNVLESSFGVAFSTKPPVNVVVEFDSSVVQRLKETIWHPKQKIEDLPGGRARLTIPLSTTLEIRPWILSWGPYAKAVSPPELVTKIRDSVAAIQSLYS